MQLHRIKLENWRGVEAAEIQLDAGITIVEGDNEAGKSSFIEALNLLFRERDSTKKQELKRVTPKGVDTGSKVEVEFTSGPYHLTYSKTFNKKTTTTLFVHKPSPVQLVGVEAHDHVLKILDETIDLGLWQAIQLEQGGEFNQVNFKNSDSLARALDSAAGGVGAGEGESVLLAKAKAEYLKYYTEKAGKETGELAELRALEKSLQQSRVHVAASLTELESFVEESARISDSLNALDQRIPAMQLSMAELKKQRAEFSSLTQKRDASLAVLNSCELKLKDIERQIAVRVELTDELRHLDKSISASASMKAKCEAHFTQCSDALQASTTERDKALKTKHVLAEQLRDYDASIALLQKKSSLQSLEQQLQQLQSHNAELSALEAELLGYWVDDVAITKIEKLDQKRHDQQVQISGHSANISFTFLKNTEVDDGDSAHSYVTGENLSVDSSKSARYKIDDSLEVEIKPAADHFELTLEHQKTVEQLQKLLADCHVESRVEATEVYRKRAKLAARIAEMKRGFDKLSKNQSMESLMRAVESERLKVSTLAAQSNTFKDTASSDSESPESLDQARLECRERLDSLEQTLLKARDLREQSQQCHADAKAKLDICVEKAAVDKQSLEKLKLKIDTFEADVSLEALELQKNQATDDLAKARTAVEAANAAIARSNSDGIDLRVENARQSLQRAQDEQRAFQLQQADVKARLDQMQSEGLHEKHQSIIAEHDDNSVRLKQLDRRARAAAKLWKTLRDHQRQAQLSYAKPLADKVVSMGRVVFGEDFSIELSESLNIVSRHLGGITVPFEDLSGGAREQLGILLRLSAAQLVSKSEAMPLILDDTLGHTDAKRLETMGAILNNAAQTSQIVVMTCYPARYSYVGSAKAVRLRQSQGVLSGSLFENL